MLPLTSNAFFSTSATVDAATSPHRGFNGLRCHGLMYVSAFSAWTRISSVHAERDCATAHGFGARRRAACGHRDWCPDCGCIPALPFECYFSRTFHEIQPNDRVRESTSRSRLSAWASVSIPECLAILSFRTEAPNKLATVAFLRTFHPFPVSTTSIPVVLIVLA